MCSCGKGLVTAAGNSLLVVMVVVIVAMGKLQLLCC